MIKVGQLILILLLTAYYHMNLLILYDGISNHVHIHFSHILASEQEYEEKMRDKGETPVMFRLVL